MMNMARRVFRMEGHLEVKDLGIFSVFLEEEMPNKDQRKESQD